MAQSEILSGDDFSEGFSDRVVTAGFHTLKSVTLDLDSTVITRNGEQEGAVRGYTRGGGVEPTTIPCWLLWLRRAWWRISGHVRETRTLPTMFCNFLRPH